MYSTYPKEVLGEQKRPDRATGKAGKIADSKSSSNDILVVRKAFESWVSVYTLFAMVRIK